jgi:organic radical activating enzyme
MLVKKLIKLKNILKKPTLKYLETNIVDHCNLNCKACTHFCSVAKKNFININSFNRDLNEIREKINIKIFRIMGGEPLLHPNICDFLYIARKHFPKTDIRLVTNGLLLKKMPEKFWVSLRLTHIKVDMSKYPPTHNEFDSYINLINENNVKIGDINDSEKFFLSLNLKGDTDKKKIYNACLSKRCKNLRNGRIMICPTACYVTLYNDAFNKSIPHDRGIDIYSASGVEIINYLKQIPDTCSYCSNREVFIEWDVSKREESEWVVKYK